MKLSIISRLLAGLLLAAVTAAVAQSASTQSTQHSNTSISINDTMTVDKSMDSGTLHKAAPPMVPPVLLRTVHVSIANVDRDVLLSDESHFLELSIVAAYESLHVKDTHIIHMVNAQLLEKTTGTTNEPPRRRQLSSTTSRTKTKYRYKKMSASEAFIRNYGKQYNFDYKLFFDPSQCNCGNFWDRRLGRLGAAATTMALSKRDIARLAAKLCNVIRHGSYSVFHKARECRVVPF